MSRTLLDDDLREWEAYASGGPFGLPDDAKIVFHCRSDPTLRARFVETEKDDDDAAAALQGASDDRLRNLFREAKPLS